MPCSIVDGCLTMYVVDAKSSTIMFCLFGCTLISYNREQFMAVHGSSWQFMSVHGSSWQFMAVHGSSWLINIWKRKLTMWIFAQNQNNATILPTVVNSKPQRISLSLCSKLGQYWWVPGRNLNVCFPLT